MTTITIRRKGEFAVRTEGSFHCGTSENLNIRYEFTARGLPSDLDERGFLFDQTKVDSFLQTQRETSLSCEQYAIKLSRDLFKLLRAENDGFTPEYLSLVLSPAPYLAELTFEWSSED